ncbi:MAG: transposase [Phycisphaerae bacterium]|nr:transposase [Phycisphaerae bacterium]
MDVMRQEIACYAHWYNKHRPHQSLKGATPLEIYEGVTPANQRPRYEPRRRWPVDAPSRWLLARSPSGLPPQELVNR